MGLGDDDTSCEHPDALHTARGRLTSVRLLVGLEDPGGDEAAPAELALVGLLPRVRAHVLLQVAGLLEAFAAVVTPGHSRDQVSARRGHEGGAPGWGEQALPTTAMHSEAELSERGVRTDSYAQ